MPQPRTPKIDWMHESVRLSAVLVNVPAKRLSTRLFGPLPLDDDVVSHLKGLQQRLNDFLNYRVSTQIAKARAASLRFDGDDSRRVIDTRNKLKKAGLDFDDRMTNAIFAHVQIGFIVQHWHLDVASRIELPVVVASIAGRSVALQAAAAAAKPRVRRNELRDAKARASAADPNASWKNLLDILEGEDIVIRWDDAVIEWTTGEGVTETTKTKTFKNWKASS